MTCCIVAALIISQLLGYRDRIKRLLGLRVDDDAGHDPLLPPELRQRLRSAVVPALALSVALALGYQHREHLLNAISPAAHAAAAAGAAGAAAICSAARSATDAPTPTGQLHPIQQH